MDNRYYDDGTPIIVALGDHGLGLKFPEYEQNGLVRLFESEENAESSLAPLYVIPNVSVGVTKQFVVSRQEKNSSDYNSFDSEPIVEFIYFGRSHRYYAKHYPLVADYWRDNLFTEARLLARSLQGDQAIAYEFVEGDGSFGAWMTMGLRGVADIFSNKPIPKPAEYDPLMKRVWDCSDRLYKSTAADYALIHEVGIEFMKIRYEQRRLTRRVRARIEDLISTAEFGEKAATEVENQAFAVLDLYGQVRYSTDPASLAAYRCGVLVVRAGARYIGEKVADSSQRKALRETGVIIRAELPKIVSGLILASMKKGFKNPQNPSMPERFAEETVGLSIWFTFFTVDFFVFEVPDLPPSEQAKSSDLFWEKFAPEFAVQIISSLIKIGFGQKIDKLGENSPERVVLERLAAVLPALIGSVVKEYVTMKKRSDDEKRPFFEVFCAEVGWALVRVFKAVGQALLEAPIQNAMKRKMASDKEFLDKNYWKGLILAIKLEMSKLDADALKSSSAKPVAWDQKIPSLKPGPDSQGNVGINKLKPVAAKPNPPQKTNPPKPSKKERKAVKPAVKTDIRKGNEFTGKMIKLKFEYNAKMVKQKWPDYFKDKPAHFMCENCGFVNSKRGLFNVDHVWDIQHGGGQNKLPADTTVDQIMNDPKFIYEMGDNSMILCIGCNGGKNTKTDRGPGFIPKDKGYAYTNKKNDMNPQHIYQGGPE